MLDHDSEQLGVEAVQVDCGLIVILAVLLSVAPSGVSPRAAVIGAASR